MLTFTNDDLRAKLAERGDAGDIPVGLHPDGETGKLQTVVGPEG
jgi:hypothetical protein